MEADVVMTANLAALLLGVIVTYLEDRRREQR